MSKMRIDTTANKGVTYDALTTGLPANCSNGLRAIVDAVKASTCGAGVYRLASGHVYDSVTGTWTTGSGRVLHGRSGHDGYAIMSITTATVTTASVGQHVLACALVTGCVPFTIDRTGRAVILQVNHLDGNTRNNCGANLEWCTPLQNNQHRDALARLRKLGFKGALSVRDLAPCEVLAI